jgi:precorrin-2 dehydrogenase / sirohydrochlorin ferrochelatase
MGAYYPIQLDLKGKSCLVIGGGEVATRKVRPLVEAGAEVVVVAPEVHPMLKADGRIEIRERAYRDTDLHGVFLVIVATDDAVTNRDAARDAADLGCLVNVVDCPALSNFIVPATLRRGGLSISISTGGASPALARRLREKIEKEFGEEWGELTAAIAEARRLVVEKVSDPARRGEILRDLAHERWLDVLRTQGRAALVAEMKKSAGV